MGLQNQNHSWACLTQSLSFNEEAASILFIPGWLVRAAAAGLT